MQYKRYDSQKAEFMLFHGAIFLAKSNKSNAVYKAILKTRQDVEQTANLDVPMHLRNASTNSLKNLDTDNDTNMLMITKMPQNRPTTSPR
jgi:putative ATPase